MSIRGNSIKVVEEISVRKFFDFFKDSIDLELISGSDGFDRMILEPTINRPALAITGYYKNFASSRIQLFGAGEMAYMRDLPDDRQSAVMEEMIAHEIPCIVISRNLAPTKPMLDAVRRHRIPLMRTRMKSKEFSAEVLVRLDRMFAPRMSLHGTLLDIKGIGTLIRGDSGIGKSEAALELIKRGHRLVSDDVVELRKVSDVTLVGSAPDITRHFIELRGIGIIDVKTLFGVSSVKDTQNIDLVIRLEDWDKEKEYDRLGLEEEYTEYLGNKVVCHNIPIRPGRNLAVICESAAINHRQKKMGYNAAQELYRRVQESLTRRRDEDEDE